MARLASDHPFTATAEGARVAAYDRLLATGELHAMPMPSGATGWMITGYDAARAALADPRLSKGGPGHGPYGDRLPPDVVAAMDSHLLTYDPPDHTRLRRLVTAAFTRRRSERLIPRIEEITSSLLGRLPDLSGPSGSVDLLAEFAYPLPITVICELLGVPDDRREDFRGWTGTLLTGMLAEEDAYCSAAIAMVAYIRELLAAKRTDPADDLLSALIAVHESGDRLTENELTAMVFLLLLAGHETTVNLIANGMRQLLTHPDQAAALRTDPSLIDGAVEELLRFDGPLQSALPAVTIAPVTIGGIDLLPGSLVVISLLAANHDRSRLADADRLDITRTGSPHLAFGHGIHYCLGAPLARIEARIAFSALLQRFPSMRLAVPETELVRNPGLLLNGLASLPVYLSAI